jgi:hypothetical protein
MNFEFATAFSRTSSAVSEDFPPRDRKRTNIMKREASSSEEILRKAKDRCEEMRAAKK